MSDTRNPTSARVTLADIDAAEGAIKNVRVALGEIGRKLYQMREGEPLGAEFQFDAYSIENFEGSRYCNQEGPDWGVGTPIVSLRFYWSRGEYGYTVTFPVRYLEIDDWKAEEQARLDGERAAAAVAALAQAIRARLKHDEAERRSYERLRAKFEADRG